MIKSYISKATIVSYSRNIISFVNKKLVSDIAIAVIKNLEKDPKL